MNKLYDNDLIKEAAERNGLNATQIAAAAQKSVPSVYQVYGGSDSINLATLKAVAEAAGLRLSIVFTEAA
jgi:hypothetical protein